jgi:hypothetical protein
MERSYALALVKSFWVFSTGETKGGKPDWLLPSGVKKGGSNRAKVVPYLTGNIQGMSPDRQWLVLGMPLPGVGAFK